MTPRTVALWHLRNARIQEARAISNGDAGIARQALANMRLHKMAVQALDPSLTVDDWRDHEADLQDLQLDFRTWLFDCARGRYVTHCTLNGAHYENLQRLLSYSRAMAIAHPGVDEIVVTLEFEDCTETHTIGKDFLEKRARILI